MRFDRLIRSSLAWLNGIAAISQIYTKGNYGQKAHTKV
jgi:hypothetical protein